MGTGSNTFESIRNAKLGEEEIECSVYLRGPRITDDRVLSNVPWIYTEYMKKDTSRDYVSDREEFTDKECDKVF